MNYKKFTAFLISICVMLFGNVIYTLSCGPDMDPYDYYVSFFNPYPSGQGYEPFYYSSLTGFYDDPTPSEAVANTGDWQQFTGSQVTAPDIREYIYTYTHEQMSAIALKSKAALPDSVRRNTFVQFLLADKNQEAARYLLFAKSCEPNVSQSDRWSAPAFDTAAMATLAAEGQELYNKTKNRDIRDRYAFQLIRLKHYMKKYPEAVAAFDELLERKPAPSLVYYKALALKAGALQHMKDTVQSAYLFTKVFDKAPSLRQSTFTSLMWSNTPEKEVYSLCKDNREKAVVAAAYGFASDDTDLGPLKKVYSFDPSSPALNVLLVREINKLEAGFLGQTVSAATDSAAMAGIVSMPAEQAATANTTIKPMIAWINTVTDKGKIKDADLWRVSSAYLSYMCRDYAAARAQLDKTNTRDPHVKDQWELVNLLVNINQQKKIDSDFENKLLTSFKWLDSRLGKRGEDYWSPGLFFNKTYRNLLGAILAPRYHQQGDMLKEALIRGRCDSLQMYDYFMSGETASSQVKDEMKSADLLKLYNFLQSSSKTPYEAYLAGYFPQGIDMERTIGESYLRVHDFKNARPWLKKAGSLAVSYQIFQDQLQDFGADTADAKHTKTISQLQFCDRMLQLQEKMKTTPVSAKVYYDYATALFNLSYYGTSWAFLKDYRPSTLWYAPANDKDPFEKQYFGCYAAESYYLKAAQAATDNEFRARCFFMAARCSQKHIAADRYEGTKFYTAAVNNRYFPVLKTNYAKTEFYQDVYGQCGYLRDFVRRTRK